MVYHARTGFPTTVMFISNHSKEARVTLVGIHIDNDGDLNSSDTLEFEIRYITVAEGSATQVINDKTMFTADLLCMMVRERYIASVVYSHII